MITLIAETPKTSAKAQEAFTSSYFQALRLIESNGLTSEEMETSCIWPDFGKKTYCQKSLEDVMKVCDHAESKLLRDEELDRKYAPENVDEAKLAKRLAAVRMVRRGAYDLMSIR